MATGGLKPDRGPALRLPQFVGGPGDPCAALAEAEVILVGLGSVGCAAAQHLARAGIGCLQLVDRGSTKQASLYTHPITAAEIGMPKAELARTLVIGINPAARVAAYQDAFQNLPIDELRGTVLLLAVDNLETELAVTEYCISRGIILIQASVHGGTMIAQLRILTGGKAGEGPCLACRYNQTEWQQVASEAQYSCDGSSLEPSQPVPTRSTSSLCSLAGELAVHKIIRHLLGLGRPLADELLEYRGYTDELVTTKLRRNRQCPVDHRRWHTVDGQGAATLAEVLRRCGADAAATVSVDGKKFLDKAACSSGHWTSVARFAALGDAAGTCPECQQPLQPSPFHSIDRVPVDAFGTRVDHPLTALGIDAGGALVVHCADGRTTRVTTPLPAPAVTGGCRT